MESGSFVTGRELQLVMDRVEAHSRRIGGLDTEVSDLRTEQHRDLAAIKEDVAIIKAGLLATQELLNKVLVGLIGGGVTIVAAAAAVIFFGPGP